MLISPPTASAAAPNSLANRSLMMASLALPRTSASVNSRPHRMRSHRPEIVWQHRIHHGSLAGELAIHPKPPADKAGGIKGKEFRGAGALNPLEAPHTSQRFLKITQAAGIGFVRCSFQVDVNGRQTATVKAAIDVHEMGKSSADGYGSGQEYDGEHHLRCDERIASEP